MGPVNEINVDVEDISILKTLSFEQRFIDILF